MYGLDDYPPDYQTNPYCIEYARSGRATCQGCKGLIDKGDLRMGSPVQFPGQDAVSYKWRHFRCLTAAVLNNMRGKVGRHGQEAAIIGLDKLRAQDRHRVERTLGEEGLAAAKEASSEEEEEEEEEESSGEEEEEPQPPPPKKKGGKKKAVVVEEEEEEAEHKPAPKTPKKRAPARRAPRLAAKRRAQEEDSDEDYQPEKQARGRRAAK